MTRRPLAKPGVEYDTEVQRELGRLARESDAVITFDWNAITDRVTFNSAGTRHLGIDGASSIPFARFLQCVDRADAGQFQANLTQILSGDSDVIEPFRFTSHDAQMLLAGRGSVVLDQQGHRHVVGIQFNSDPGNQEHLPTAMSPEQKAHQVKNILGVVSGMAAMSGRLNRSPGEFVRMFNSRIKILARCADLVATSTTGFLPITVFVSNIASASIGSGAVKVESSGFGIDIGACQILAIAIHELATNAATHGSLHAVGGEALVSFTNGDDGSLRFEWSEKSPAFSESEDMKTGFGMYVLTRAIAREFGTDPQIDWRDDGMTYSFNIPTDRLVRFGASE